MLTLDEIVRDRLSIDKQAEIYNQAPVSKYDCRYKKTLQKRRCYCLLHDDKWENSSSIILKTIWMSLEHKEIPIKDEAKLQSSIERGTCSCSHNFMNNQVTDSNIPEEVIISETEEMRTFYHNLFNSSGHGEGIHVIQQPILDILTEYVCQPDIQTYLFLKWIKNLIGMAFKCDILIECSKECGSNEKNIHDSTTSSES